MTGVEKTKRLPNVNSRLYKYVGHTALLEQKSQYQALIRCAYSDSASTSFFGWILHWRGSIGIGKIHRYASSAKKVSKKQIEFYA